MPLPFCRPQNRNRKKSEDGPRPTSVYTAPVNRQSTTLEVLTQGEVRARTEIDLVSQVGGRIVSVSPEFTEGGLIEPDVTLLRIEDTDYRLALSQAAATVAEAQVVWSRPWRMPMWHANSYATTLPPPTSP